MTTARFSLRALWSDQGMAHMLETYDSNEATAPTGLALVDFGAETMFKSRVLKTNLAAPAITSVVNTLLRQQEAGLPPRLDYVVISHQDTDHWSLLKYLMDAVDELELPMTVGRIIYAGADWGKSAIATVKRLATYGEDGEVPIDALRSTISDYGDANGELGRLVRLGDVVLRVLIANAPVASKSSSLRKNGTSAVIVTDFASERMILPGDATWETLNAANKLLAKWTTSPVQPVKMMSAPHHGSLSTMTPKNEGKDSNLEQLEAFTELTKPEAVIASAGFKNSFKHPYLIILKVMGKYTAPSPTNPGLGKHPTVVYMLNTSDWAKFDVEKNIYTSVVGLTSPVPVANYLFTRNEHGFFTDVFGFYGPSKAMISVPSTSFQVIGNEMMEIDDEDMSGGPGSGDIIGAPWLAVPRARPAPPPRRVAPNVSHARGASAATG